MKESTPIAGHQARSEGQLVLKTPQFPDGFQQNIFKGHVRGRSHNVCNQVMHNSLTGDGEVTG